jgi:diguanylate cyclase (GGDEF)-like protein/PAS domain S-box-containing protein
MIRNDGWESEGSRMMNDGDNRSKQAHDLLHRAEQFLNDKRAASPEVLRTMTSEEIWRALRSLQVHEIELAMQNDELRGVQAELEISHARYFDLYDMAPIGYCSLSKKGIILEANHTVASMLGTTRSKLALHPLSRFILKEDQDVFYKLHTALYANGQPRFCELRLLHADGTSIWGHLDASIAQNSEGDPVFRIMIQDISLRKELESALAVEKKLMETTLRSIGDGVISTDQKGIIVYLNPVAEFLTGWTQADAQGKPVQDIFDMTETSTGEKSKSIVSLLLASRQAMELTNGLLVSKSGKKRPIEISAAPILYENDEIIGVVLAFRDYTERKQRQEEIEYLCYYDQLTGLCNRRFFEEAHLRMDIDENLPLSIAMGDVNGLKLVNDSFGHATGDELLIKVAQAMKKGCRADDVIARLGGDEFVVIMPKTDKETAEKVITRMKELSRNETVRTVGISISFGCETKSRSDESIQETIKDAENHMYRHKLAESSSIRSKTIDLIMSTLFEKNNREMLHSERVGKICAEIATEMNFNTDDVNQIRIAGMMHDIGKIGIAESILNSPQKLNGEERQEVERHSEIGYRILSSVNEFSKIADYVLENHEKWNGKGYPKGLKHDEISLQGRIIAIADAFDAMTSSRTYRKALSRTAAISEIRHGSGIQFDPDIAELFVVNVCGESW